MSEPDLLSDLTPEAADEYLRRQDTERARIAGLVSALKSERGVPPLQWVYEDRGPGDRSGAPYSSVSLGLKPGSLSLLGLDVDPFTFGRVPPPVPDDGDVWDDWRALDWLGDGWEAVEREAEAEVEPLGRVRLRAYRDDHLEDLSRRTRRTRAMFEGIGRAIRATWALGVTAQGCRIPETDSPFGAYDSLPETHVLSSLLDQPTNPVVILHINHLSQETLSELWTAFLVRLHRRVVQSVQETEMGRIPDLDALSEAHKRVLGLHRFPEWFADAQWGAIESWASKGIKGVRDVWIRAAVASRKVAKGFARPEMSRVDTASGASTRRAGRPRDEDRDRAAESFLIDSLLIVDEEGEAKLKPLGNDTRAKVIYQDAADSANLPWWNEANAAGKGLRNLLEHRRVTRPNKMRRGDWAKAALTLYQMRERTE